MTMSEATPVIISTSVTPDPEYGFSVRGVWGGVEVDIPDTPGYLIRDRKLAERLAAAIRAGVVFVDPEVKTNVNGKTYVNARSTVLGRMVNADLRRLGH
jgi:hypothetical protein